MATVYQEQELGREIWKDEFKGQVCRLPALMAGRYEPEKIQAQGGFGMLIVARDRRVYKRQVLIKKPVLGEELFLVQNNLSVSDRVRENFNRAEHERKMLLHGQFRGISGIPVLIDWFNDLDPMVYGPHRDKDGKEFVIDTPELYSDCRYLVLNYFEGFPLDDFCTRDSFRKNLVGALRYLGLYIANILKRFHKVEEFGTGNPIYMVYQTSSLKISLPHPLEHTS